MPPTACPDPLTAISDPERIRLRLARTVREADILRRLLRLAESAKRELGDPAFDSIRDGAADHEA